MGNTPRGDAKKEEDLYIDMGDLHYDVLYMNRSFVVENQSSMPLDFLILHDVPGSSATELNFSLSNTALKVFSTLRVAAHSKTRVFLHFRTSTRREPAAAGEGAVQPTRAPSIDTLPAELQIEISVSCRLVKDHRKLIHLHATCRPPQLSLSHTDLAFSLPTLEPSSSRSASNLVISAKPPQSTIQVLRRPATCCSLRPGRSRVL